MRRMTAFIFSLVAVFVATLHPTLADERVALIIGNSTYQNVPDLPTPVNDAEDMAAMLGGLGFTVRSAVDLNRTSMEEALLEFSDQAASADIALVFYAGHSIAIDLETYLIPVDAKLETDLQVSPETVSLDFVLAAIDGAKGLRMVLLDACRNNPFAATMTVTASSRSVGRCLARMEANPGTLISFSAKEGTVAVDGESRNSPYTAALLSNLKQPGLAIDLLFSKVRDNVMAKTNHAQEPFVSTSLSSDAIYLVPPTDNQIQITQPVPQPDLLVTDYGIAERLNTEAAWEAFLAKHGASSNNQYVDLAKSALQKLALIAPVPKINPQVAPDQLQFKLRANSDAVGSDIAVKRGLTSDACRSACAMQVGCDGVTYDRWNRVCILKRGITGLAVNAKSTTLLKESVQARQLSTSVTLLRRTGRSFPDQPYRSFSAASYDDCAKRCLQDARCMAVNFRYSGRCESIDAASEYQPTEGSDIGYKMQDATQSQAKRYTWEGYWSSKQHWCKNYNYIGNVDPSPTMVTANKVIYLGGHCAVTKVLDITDYMFKFRVKCTGEGDEWSETISGKYANGKLKVRSTNGPNSTLQRCKNSPAL